MDKFNTHQVTMGIKKSIKQQNSKQKRHIAPKSKEFRSWILQKVIDNGKNNSLNIWILDDPKIWGTHLNRREVVMRTPCFVPRVESLCKFRSNFPKCGKDLANKKEIKVRDETCGKKNLSFTEFKETKEKQRATFSRKNSRKISVILSRLISVLWYRIAVS